MKTELLRTGPLLASLLCALASMAPRGAEAQGRDYSRGFEMVRSLGLPDLRDWLYVGAVDRGYGSLFDALEIEFEGNAWAEREADAEGIRRITFDGVAVTTLGWEQVASTAETEEDQAAYLGKVLAAGLQPGIWIVELKDGEADENADAAALAEALAESLAQGSGGSMVLNDANIVAALFFRAAHWHHRGLEEEAAALLDTLFEHLPRPAALLESALAKLANERHAAAMRRFGATGDWGRLASELESLLSDFPRLWPERPLAARLHAMVAEGAAGPPPSVEGLPGLPLDEGQTAWWEDLTEAGGEADQGADGGLRGRDVRSESESSGQLWARRLLPRPEAESGGPRSQPWERPSAIDLDNGWDWIAVFAAALGDETLMRLGMASAVQSGMHSSHFRRGDWRDLSEEPAELTESELEERWRAFDRPPTRDDLARSFLKGAVPRGEGHPYDWWENAESEEILEAVLAWREKLEGKDGRGIIDLYLAEGSDREREWAATALAQTGTEEDLATLEEMTLATPQRALQVATEILRRRRAEGRAYLEAFTERLREEQRAQDSRFRRGGSTEEDFEKEFQNRYGSQLQRLEALASGAGFRDLLSAYLEGSKSYQELANGLSAIGGDQTGREDVEAVFAAVLAPELPRERDRQLLFNLAISIAQAALQGEGSADVGEREGPVELPDWLLDSYRTLADGGAGIELASGPGSRATLARLALYRLDATIEAGAASAAAAELQGLPSELVWEHFEARGRARLAGEAPPETPTPGEVAEVRRGEIEAGLAKLGDPGWAEWVESLDLAEAMVLREALAAAEPGPERRAAALRVRKVTLADGEWQEGWDSLAGTDFGPEFLGRLLDLCQASLAGGGPGVEGALAAHPLHTGIEIRVAHAEEDGSSGAASMWGRNSLDDYRRHEEPSGIVAVAYATAMTQQGNFSVVRALGRDREWRELEEGEIPAGYYSLPFPDHLSGESLAEALEAFSGALADSTPSNFQFGTMRAGEDEEEDDERENADAP